MERKDLFPLLPLSQGELHILIHHLSDAYSLPENMPDDSTCLLI